MKFLLFQDGVFIYDATDPKNLVFKSRVAVEGDTDSVVFFKDDNYLVTGSGLYGIAIVNMTNLDNAYMICNIINFSYINFLQI